MEGCSIGSINKGILAPDFSIVNDFSQNEPCVMVSSHYPGGQRIRQIQYQCDLMWSDITDKLHESF